MAMFALMCLLVAVAVGSLLVSMTALDRANEVHERQDHTETRVSELGKQMLAIRRAKAGYPERSPVAHRDADVYDFPPRPPAPWLIEDLERALG